MRRSPKSFLNQQALTPNEMDALLSEPQEAKKASQPETIELRKLRLAQELADQLGCSQHTALEINNNPWVIAPLQAALEHNVRLIELVFRDVGHEVAARITLGPVRCSKKESHACAQVFLGEAGHFKMTITKQIPTKEKAAELFAGALSSLATYAQRLKGSVLSKAEGPSG